MNLKLKNSLLLLSLIVVGSAFCFFNVMSHTEEIKMMDEPSGDIKVSVIVPVYNTEKYLDECLRSIENQTLREIEIILVNDGSKDGSRKILEEHAKNDERIKVINQENAGVAAARNHGLREAHGDYVAFVDSDDVIAPWAYEKLYASAKKYRVNVVASELTKFEDGTEPDINSMKYDDSKVSFHKRRKYQNPFYDMIDNTAFMVTKIYRRSFLAENNIWFKEGVTHYEDGLFNFLVFARLREVVQDKNPFYCYRIDRPGSAVTEFNAKKVLKASTTVSKELVENFDLFNFNRGSEWLVSKILDLNYQHITKDTQDENDKKYFAKIVVDLITEKLINEQGVKMLDWQKKQFNELKNIAYPD
ncbi:MAG: glycosyltransferase [Clostridia bacterium]|nr:glycosyltransferase [Clostridia bacterium]